MIRIIAKSVSTCPDGVVTGVRYQTFDIQDSALEAFLSREYSYLNVSVVGAELLTSTEQGKAHG